MCSRENGLVQRVNHLAVSSGCPAPVRRPGAFDHVHQAHERFVDGVVRGPDALLGRPRPTFREWRTPTRRRSRAGSGPVRTRSSRPGDLELKGRADWIVSELGRCQRENGGEWVFSIPEKYLDSVARKRVSGRRTTPSTKRSWAWWTWSNTPGSTQALDILTSAAKWFTRWTRPFSREHMDDILDYETGGMLEVWADLYGITGKGEHWTWSTSTTVRDCSTACWLAKTR